MFEIQALGYVGSDPEMRYLDDGREMTKLSVSAKTGYGENKVTSWVRCICFGKLAETIDQYVKKGDMLWIRGEVSSGDDGEPHKFESKKDGEVHASYEIVLRDFAFAGGKKDKDGGE